MGKDNEIIEGISVQIPLLVLVLLLRTIDCPPLSSQPDRPCPIQRKCCHAEVTFLEAMAWVHAD